MVLFQSKIEDKQNNYICTCAHTPYINDKTVNKYMA